MRGASLPSGLLRAVARSARTSPHALASARAISHLRNCSSVAAAHAPTPPIINVVDTPADEEAEPPKDVTVDNMKPKEIMAQLDQYIVGQSDAKKAVAVAMRNRWRRQRVDKPLREDIVPKNILMIGPTGVGKTEIARRLAKLANAPFIKVEATKYTEVGFVGKDVEQIIRDLMDVGMVRRHRTTPRVPAPRPPPPACHSTPRVLTLLPPPPSVPRSLASSLCSPGHRQDKGSRDDRRKGQGAGGGEAAGCARRAVEHPAQSRRLPQAAAHGPPR